MIYLDTSAMVAILLLEDRTADVIAWLEDAQINGAELWISPWVIAEVHSALAINERIGRLARDERVKCLAELRRFSHEAASQLSIEPRHFSMAARYADHVELRIRAADALHLAVAGDRGATLATLDRVQAAAGSNLGIKTILI